MIPALIGKKVGMTRVIDADGTAQTVTVLKAGPCVVLQVKSPESDGYAALQLGFEDVAPHRSTKPMIGHAATARTGPKRYVREIRLPDAATAGLGDVLTVEQFSAGGVAKVDVLGVTKGKGFQGVMKRHGFGGQPASHGTERKHRSPGGIGANASRGHGRCVKKGKRMAGHMGNVRRTSCSLSLVRVDPAHDVLLVAGSVPGPVGGMVVIREAKRKG